MEIEQLGRDEARSLSIDSNWIIAKGLWLDADRLSLDENTKRGFQKFLSTAQYHSFVMLRDWLRSKYEIEPVVREFYDSIHRNEEESLIHEGQFWRNPMLRMRNSDSGRSIRNSWRICFE